MKQIPKERNWREDLEEAMKPHGESMSSVESSTFTTTRDLDTRFNHSGHKPAGKPFTVWTAKRVYFPVWRDGFEAIASVARHPDAKPTQHV